MLVESTIYEAGPTPPAFAPSGWWRRCYIVKPLWTLVAPDGTELLSSFDGAEVEGLLLRGNRSRSIRGDRYHATRRYAIVELIEDLEKSHLVGSRVRAICGLETQAEDKARHYAAEDGRTTLVGRGLEPPRKRQGSHRPRKIA